VADRLDSSASTFSQQLRAAQWKLLTALFEERRPAAGNPIDID